MELLRNAGGYQPGENKFTRQQMRNRRPVSEVEKAVAAVSKAIEEWDDLELLRALRLHWPLIAKAATQLPQSPIRLQQHRRRSRSRLKNGSGAHLPDGLGVSTRGSVSRADDGARRA